MAKKNKEKEIKQLRDDLSVVKQELNDIRVEVQRQLEIAVKVQRSLLPKPIQEKSIHVDTRYIPIDKIGGDYCQARLINPETCYITMSDVTGHGIGAALLASRVSSEVRHYILDEYEPQDIVKNLNQFIWNNFNKTGLYLSFIAARINLKRLEITWCGAGHPSPLLIRCHKSKVERLQSQNPWIGVQKNIPAKEPKQCAKLGSGDRLVFYTDGLVEVVGTNRWQPGINGLADIALKAMKMDLFEMADCILDKVTHNRKVSPKDDISLIVVEIK